MAGESATFRWFGMDLAGRLDETVVFHVCAGREKEAAKMDIGGIPVRLDDTLKPGERRIEAVPNPLDPNRGLRATIDYERSAHRKTTELLIEKDRKVQDMQLQLDAMRRDLDVRKKEGAFAIERWKLEQKAADLAFKRSDREYEAIKLCIPIVRDLFEFTSDYKIHAACKAALAAYEELTHAAVVAGEPAPDPVDVGVQAVRHLSDCQQERPPGVSGSQLPGPAGREGDHAQGCSGRLLPCWDRVLGEYSQAPRGVILGFPERYSVAKPQHLK